MEAVLRRLADVEPGDLPVLSIYLDMRPQVTGENPALRTGLVVLKDRLTGIFANASRIIHRGRRR